MKHLVLACVLLNGCKMMHSKDSTGLSSTTSGCGYIQHRENQLFAQASRMQDVLFGMLDEFNASAERYQQETGKTLTFVKRQFDKDFQEFLLTHKEKTINFRAMQNELHKVFGQLQTVNLINYSNCPDNPRLELDGMHYGIVKDKKPISCSNYQNEIAQQKDKIAELTKIFTTAEQDVAFSSEQAETLYTEASKIESLSNKILYTFIASDVTTVAAVGGYSIIYNFLGAATPIAIAGLEISDFILSLAWIYTSTKTSDLRLEAQRLRSKYQLAGVNNSMIMKEMHRLEANNYFVENMFKNFCRKG